MVPMRVHIKSKTDNTKVVRFSVSDIVKDGANYRFKLSDPDREIEVLKTAGYDISGDEILISQGNFLDDIERISAS